MLNTIHVTITINNATRKRPLRMYDAATNTYGVVVKGACVPVTPKTPTSVVLAKGAGKNPDNCRALRLADLGVAKSAKPMPDFVALRAAKPAKRASGSISVADLIAMLKAQGISVSA